MATQITPEQMIELESNTRHQALCKQWVKDLATYFTGLNSGNEEWAKKRFIAAGIAFHPQSHNYTEWAIQMTALLKGQSVWDGDVDGTVDFLITNNKYEELAGLIFTKRSSIIEF